MKRFGFEKKLLVLGVFCLSWGAVYGLDIQWDPVAFSGTPGPKTTYTIPDDGNTYYMSTGVTVTDALYIYGTFEVRDGGTFTNNNQKNAADYNGYPFIPGKKLSNMVLHQKTSVIYTAPSEG